MTTTNYRLGVLFALRAGILIAISAVSPAFANSVTVGTTNTNNCIPFSCPNQFGTTEDQQVFAASAFPGPLTINNFELYVSNFGGGVETATYDVYFSTTPAAVNGLSATFSENLGADNQFFGEYNLGGETLAPGDTLLFSGSPFNYNPSDGNLLMTVLISSTSGSFGGASFEGDFGDDMSRVTNGPGQGPFYEGNVTTFDVSTTPEPGGFWLALPPLFALLALPTLFVAWRGRRRAFLLSLDRLPDLAAEPRRGEWLLQKE